jgi:DNA-binding phage protein
VPNVVRYPTFDAADHLDTPEMVAGFISDAFDTGDATYIAGALGIAARGNPKLKTVIATLKALGLRLHADPESPSRKRPHTKMPWRVKATR